jgi:TetR/AcrR family transcriptional regulator, cholesterol catabolism regulator
LQTGWPVGSFSWRNSFCQRDSLSEWLVEAEGGEDNRAAAGIIQMPANRKLRQRTPAAANREDRLTVDRYLARESDIDCRIIDAAARLFRQHGFANVRMQDIGIAVGLSKAGLYHHCPSKEELLANIVRLCGELLAIQLSSVQAMKMTPEEKLKAFIVSRMETILSHQDFFTVIWQERPFINRADFSDMAKRAQAYRGGVRQMIKEAKSAGVIAEEVDPHLLMLALDGMTGWAYLWFRGTGRENPTRIGLAFWNYISKGILA